MADINLGVGGANSAVAGGYDIANSLKFESDNSERISFTPSSAVASERRKHTISFWIKRTELGSTQYIYEWGGSEGDYLRNFLRFQSDDTLRFATSYNVIINTTRVFRDTSAWYHIVIQTDTVQSSNSDTKFWMYVNGELEGSSIAFNVNDTMAFANNSQHDIGFTSVDNGAYGNYYLAEFNAVGGLKLAPTDFGETDDDSGIWKPKAYTGSYGTNGFYLDFENSGSLGADGSGNGNNFTLNNITSADQATDTPTNNFCTLNPLVNFKYTTNGITEGGTVFGNNTGGGVGGAFGTFGVSTGKWYWEVKLTDTVSHYIGVSADDGDNVLSSSDPHQINSTFNFNIGAARIEYINNGSVTAGSLDAFTDFHSVGDIIGIALNMDDNQISIYGNGTLQSGVANSSLYDASDKTVVPFHGTINDECQYNFGGYSAWTQASPATDENGYGTFEYAPPSGYYALCTKNLAEYG